MRKVRNVLGPLLGNFAVWTLISYLPVHPIVIFTSMLQKIAMTDLPGTLE